ncbi:MAG TPA: hypothetical protein PKJ33_02980 [Alphaproteobacteria bacterium]|nr:hypothetical protein [Alphaproteobacteria bacterium]
MKKIFLAFVLLCSTPSFAITEYRIQVAHDDSFFIINGERFSAQTYCFASDGFDVNDWVIFVDGSPLGACASATISNTDTGATCDLWCE